ncbi:MAG: PepSY-associated TM helix domain-containing protein [Bacteroidota bacterium]
MPTKRQRQARILRKTRRVHRLSGITLFVFFFIMAVTGLLLGWKKNSGGTLLPNTQKGTDMSMENWLPLDTLSILATQGLFQATGQLLEIDRVDVRPSKGILKYRFAGRQQEVQIDGATGEILSVGRRHSDWIEQVHDGSIVDNWLGIPHGIFKVFYNSVMGLALVIFTVSGFWLWYGPRRMRRS